MGITLTNTGGNIWNFPDTSPPSITPNDLVVTEATSTLLKVVSRPLPTKTAFEILLEGQFSYGGDVVGMGYGDSRSIMSGAWTKETTSVASAEYTQTEIYSSSTPVQLKTTGSLQSSLTDLQAEFAGDDVFTGDRDVASSDGAHGYGGNDRFVMTYGKDFTEKFRGGDGIDTAVFESSSNHWKISPTDSAWNPMTDKPELDGYRIEDNRLTGTSTYGVNGHILEIVEVERLVFTDKKVALDFGRGENSYTTAALITTMFGSESVPTYFGPAVGLVDQGQTAEQIAQLVIDLNLIDVSSNKNFVETIYKNVVGVAPDPLTQAIYAGQLDSGAISHAGLVAIGSNASLIESQMSELAAWQNSGLDYLGL